ncbi:MAG: DEAD/DEAH box helicase family protein [Verrucomicrobia bacterium]|nr:DEAD/DEAH box helicase family protein [Verrucomicrobiota bacterium]
MIIKTLKRFQEDAVQSGFDVFSYTKQLLDAAGKDPVSRATAIYKHGCLLIEAPTGSGKTLIAGHITERFSHIEDVVWFWFAPFRGVVDQTAAFLREQYAGLRLRTLSDDRMAGGSRRGDVFVTTWQTVATRVKDNRNVRRSGEQNPSVDELIAELRVLGLRIGVVVDEAHHGFHGDTQASEFFRGVLRPEYTILITATPDDADLADLQKRAQLRELNRITISRGDAVRDGLVKEGIKCVAWKADEEREALIDFEVTALAEGRRLHQMLKAALAEQQIALTPLMLVQVDSSTKSVERAKEKLLKLGFTDAQIATHTAKEPDPSLLALANDETREVLIFKMAVALGFDAPRAWTLVSMRATKDPDFGVQLVGRILRVHRRLQGRKMPPLLNYGYVLLADAAGQGGIDVAGQRINQLQTAYAKVSPTTVIVQVGGRPTVQVVGADGVGDFFPIPPEGAIPTTQAEDSSAPDVGSQNLPIHGSGFSFPLDWLLSTEGAAPAGFAVQPPGVIQSRYRYRLKPTAPRRFTTQSLPEDFRATEEDCARKFMVSAQHLIDVFKGRVQVQKQTLEIFTQEWQTEFAFATLSPEQMAIEAQRLLFKSPVFHAKELRHALLRRLTEILQSSGFPEASDEGRVAQFLDILLVTHPQLLVEAQKAALAEGARLEEAGEIPVELTSDDPLPHSGFNVYGILPPGMNNWERLFADFLESDMSGKLLWWHRNLPHKEWSVRLLLTSGKGFFPDFIIGIKDRPKPDNALLVDTKYAFETAREAPKILADHNEYGRVLIVHKTGEKRWAKVRFDESGKPILGDEFRVVDAPGL